MVARHPRFALSEVHQRLEARFWKYVHPEPNTGCFLWSGSAQQGYGQIRALGRLMQATHVALWLDGRPLPEGLSVLHRCDNPSCVNPEHLFVGTQQDNIADCIAKGRASKPPISKPGRWRPEFCKRGHQLSGDNVYLHRGRRRCCECRTLAKHRFRARLAADGLTSRGTPKATVS